MIALAIAFGALFVASLFVLNHERTTAWKRQVDIETRHQAVVSDLLNRLAARNLPEYVAYLPDQDPEPARTYLFDDFNLLSDEVQT